MQNSCTSIRNNQDRPQVGNQSGMRRSKFEIPVPERRRSSSKVARKITKQDRARFYKKRTFYLVVERFNGAGVSVGCSNASASGLLPQGLSVQGGLCASKTL